MKTRITKKKNKKSKKTKKQKKYNLKGGNLDEDETHCKLVSSYGIMKASKKIEGVYYVKSDHIDSFTIPNEPFVLVTGNEDTTMIEDTKEKAEAICNSPNLIHWYTQNLTKHDNHKLSIIPIGLDYHTIAEHKAGYEWWGAKETPVQQEKYLINLEKLPFEKREAKIYCNFLQSIRGRYGGKDRKEALEQISDELLVKEEDKLQRNNTWKNMVNYAFVLSPHGNGLDCHRTWEALALGCIPIVKKSPIDKLYEDLPVLIVDNWSDVSKDLLLHTIEEFKNKSFNTNKLNLSYWINKIKNSQQRNVIALCTNNAYLDKAKRTIDEIRRKGQWTGDLVLFHDSELDNLSQLKEEYTLTLKKFPKIDTSKVEQELDNNKSAKYKNLRAKMFQYFKFNIFNTYFKQWDSVLYIDVGMHIMNPLQRFFDLDIKGKLLANSDSQPSFEWTLENQFDLNSEYSKNLIEHYDLNKKDYFQSGVLLFDTHIIEENTVSKLIELMNAYPIANGDQAIMNLYFLNMRNLWTQLPLRDNEGLLYDYDERNNKKEDYIMIKYPKS